MKYYFCLSKAAAECYIIDSDKFGTKCIIMDYSNKKEYYAVDYIKNVAAENKGYLLYSIDVDPKYFDNFALNTGDGRYIKHLWPDTSNNDHFRYDIILYDDLNKLLIKNGIKSENKEEEKKETYYIDIPWSHAIKYIHDIHDDHNDINYVIIKDNITNNLINVKIDNGKVDTLWKLEIDPKHLQITEFGINNYITIYDKLDYGCCDSIRVAIFKDNKVPQTKSLKSLYPYTEHWLDEYIKERPEFPPINTYVKYNENEVKENKMTIKDIKINGPATIIFWADNTKTIVKCQAGEQNDPEKGIIMALIKGLITKSDTKCKNNWTKIFDIPYSDEVDVEKTIGLYLLKNYYEFKLNDKEWHYNYVLKYLYKHKGFKLENEIRALKGLGYSDERIKKCLKTNYGVIRDALKINKAEEPGLDYSEIKKPPVLPDMFADEPQTKEIKWLEEKPREEIKEESTESSKVDKILDMFNKGYSISKISKEMGITEYYVKKYIDIATNPEVGKNRAARILNSITKQKNKNTEKKERKPHVKHTKIDFPDYLDEETCKMVLERTKEKYKDLPKIQYLSELQKYFIMECKREYIVTHYGNGYDMYTIAKVLGINAASVQRIWNSYKAGKEN